MPHDLELTVRYRFAAAEPSAHVALVGDHFGLDAEPGEHVVADRMKLKITSGDVVLFTGPSGSGKSSLLRAAVTQLRDRDATVVDAESVPLPNTALVDGLGLPFDDSLALLTACGLAEPQILLRRPAELSDGQRFRYRLAIAAAGLKRVEDDRFLAIDEFTATLDRTLAKAVAFNLGRLARRNGFGVLAATTHEDVAADLAPTLRVRCDLDGEPRVEPAADVKKNGSSRSRAASSSRPARDATGRISLGGITGVTRSG